MSDLIALAYGLLAPAVYVLALAALAGAAVTKTGGRRACYGCLALALAALPTVTGWGI